MKKMTIGTLIILSALIWGIVIVWCGGKLKGTSCYSEISNILVGGVMLHFIAIWVPLASQFRKKKS